MSTSDRTVGKGSYFRVIGACLLLTLFCVLFGAVYECFSHEVYSYFMLYAFVFPLLLGVLPFFLRFRLGRPFPRRAAVELILSGMAFLTVGSLVQGVLEIYGTTSPLMIGYWISGLVLTAGGWLLAIPKKDA